MWDAQLGKICLQSDYKLGWGGQFKPRITAMKCVIIRAIELFLPEGDTWEKNKDKKDLDGCMEVDRGKKNVREMYIIVIKNS